MNNHLRTSSVGIFLSLVTSALCLSAKADFVGGSYASGTPFPAHWDQWNGQNPFYSSIQPGKNLKEIAWIPQSPPPLVGVVSDAQYYPASQTFTAPQGHYALTAISILTGGSPSGTLQMHLYDITSTLHSDYGPVTTGIGAQYDSGVELLGNGSGLSFENYGASRGTTNQQVFTLGTGTTDDTGIVIGDGHYYALEIWAPSTAPETLSWLRPPSSAFCDLTGQAFLAGGESATRLTLSLAGMGGSPRDFALALFGTATDSPITVPEPGSIALWGLGLATALIHGRKGQ